jgi:peptidoglycan/xylan/chitin deacetylase (PgdA/CDA1 family)
MIDAALGVGIAAGLALGLYAAWRRLRGRPRSSPRAVVRGVVAAVLGMAIAGSLLWTLMGSRTFQVAGDLVWRVDTAQKMVAITFDDGPEPQHLPEVLAMLAGHQAKATFFVTGSQVAANPDAAAAMVAAGHQLGNHTWNHTRLIFLDSGALAGEIERTDQAIVAAGYHGPIMVRPPNGKRLFAAPVYLAQNRRTTVMWSLEPDSIAAIADDPEAMRRNVSQQVRPGDIILLHVMYDSRTASRAALGLILDDLVAQGYQLVTVNELLAARR